MTDNVDLSGNVDEVKDQIRDAENPDLEALLEEEKSGKDRKTIKEFLEKRIDKEEAEVDEAEVDEAEDEVVEQIEEETEGGLLGGFSREAVMASGLVAGLVLGLVFGAGAMNFSGSADADITAQQAEDRISQLFELQQGLAGFSVDSVSQENGMYYIESTVEQEVQAQNNSNETSVQEFPQNFYMTLDGQYLFQERQNQFTGQVVSPIPVDQTIERLENQSQQPSQEPVQ